MLQYHKNVEPFFIATNARSLENVRKPDFSARIRKLSANVENFPQTGPGQKSALLGL